MYDTSIFYTGLAAGLGVGAVAEVTRRGLGINQKGDGTSFNIYTKQFNSDISLQDFLKYSCFYSTTHL